MPQSHCQLYTHLIFSTKDRQPILRAEIRPRVHAYMAALLRDTECSFACVGGVEDHVHILFALGKTQTPVSAVEKVKKESSKFVKTLGEEFRDFYWQRGYGMFSISPTHRDDVERYITEQEEHHRSVSFQDEYRGFLKRYDIAYDERYVWD